MQSTINFAFIYGATHYFHIQREMSIELNNLLAGGGIIEIYSFSIPLHNTLNSQIFPKPMFSCVNRLVSIPIVFSRAYDYAHADRARE